MMGMKRLYQTIPQILFLPILVVLFAFTNTSQAATCGSTPNDGWAPNNCGAKGGCPDGQRCFSQQGYSACGPDGTCTTTTVSPPPAPKNCDGPDYDNASDCSSIEVCARENSLVPYACNEKSSSCIPSCSSGYACVKRAIGVGCIQSNPAEQPPGNEKKYENDSTCNGECEVV